MQIVYMQFTNTMFGHGWSVMKNQTSCEDGCCMLHAFIIPEILKRNLWTKGWLHPTPHCVPTISDTYQSKPTASENSTLTLIMYINHQMSKYKYLLHLESLTRNLRKDWFHYQVVENCLSPGQDLMLKSLPPCNDYCPPPIFCIADIVIL